MRKKMRKNTKKWHLVQATKHLLMQYSDMRLTLRQIYYRLVALEIIKNTLYEYQYLSGALVHGRKERILDPDYFVDLTRSARVQTDNLYTKESWWKDWIMDLKRKVDDYGVDRWAFQVYKVFVILEKQALENVFRAICEQLGVTLVVNRGYNSYTQIYEIVKQIRENAMKEPPLGQKQFIFLTFGDHDPSGRDIIRNFEEQIEDEGIIQGVEIKGEFKHIALTPKQIKKYKLPPAPAKKGDARSKKFIAEFGDAVVELDAIEPNKLQDMVEESVQSYFDNDFYEREIVTRQTIQRKYFKKKFEENQLEDTIDTGDENE